MTKTEAPVKKTEAKEEGAKSNKRKRICSCNGIIISIIAAILLILFVVAIVYGFSVPKPRAPLFILEDLYVDSVSNSSVMVKLTSRNPSSKISVYYSKIRIRAWVEGDFETESVSLANTVQEPYGVLTWTAAVVTNSDKARLSGSFPVRDGMTKGGYVITESSIKRKRGIFSTSDFRLRVTCPVLLNIKDLTSAVSKPMSSCASDLITSPELQNAHPSVTGIH